MMRCPRTTGPSVQHCSCRCVTAPWAAKAALPELSRQLLSAEGRGTVRLHEHQMLQGSAHPLVTQDLLGLDSTSPQAARGPKGQVTAEFPIAKWDGCGLTTALLLCQGKLCFLSSRFLYKKNGDFSGQQVWGLAAKLNPWL